MATNRPISAIMTVSPVVANPSNTFSQVLRLFTEFPVHHLPIVDDNSKLIGIISTNDLPKVFLQLCDKKVTMDLAAIDKAISLTDIMTEKPVTIASNETIGN